VITRGVEAVRAHLKALAAKGFGAAIADAVFERDLETIGEVALDHRVSVGASGLGLGLARALVASGAVQSHATASVSDTPVGGLAACLAGSCSQATLGQIEHAERIMPVLRLDPEQVIAGSAETARALGWAKERLDQGPVLIASSSTPDQVSALQARHGRDAAGHAIEQAMADLAQGLVGSGVRRLVVAGGETSGAVVDRLGIPGFLVGPEIAAGVPVLRAVGGNDGEMLLALKSGNFGGPEFFGDALHLMR
jgi:3-dehydrotetronate 4-kinase